MKKLILLALMVSLLAACEPATTPAPTPLPTPAAEWAVKLAQSGGIMGMLQVIKVSSDGSYVAMDQRVRKVAHGQLSETDLSHLQELITNTLKVASIKPASDCADCFIFTVEITGLGQPFQMQVNEQDLSNSGLEPLAVFLRDVMANVLK